MLSAHEVSLRRGGNVLLDQVSIQVPVGRLTMLIGPNGAGKSTLLRMLAGTLRPDQGEIRLDGEPLAGWTARQMAARRAVVPQSMDIAFRFSASEVVELGMGEGLAEVGPRRRPATPAFAGDARSNGGVRRDTVRDVVAHVMRLTDCEVLATRSYADLSGGERARVQVARALAQLRMGAPAAASASASAGRYLLLDEPVASLDPGQQHRLLALLSELIESQGIGVLVTMHDLNLASQYADRVWLLRSGQMVTDGAADDVVDAHWIGPVFDVGLRPLQVRASLLSRRPVATVPPGRPDV